jgi:hypothetical protein
VLTDATHVAAHGRLVDLDDLGGNQAMRGGMDRFDRLLRGPFRQAEGMLGANEIDFRD